MSNLLKKRKMEKQISKYLSLAETAERDFLSGYSERYHYDDVELLRAYLRTFVGALTTLIVLLKHYPSCFNDRLFSRYRRIKSFQFEDWYKRLCEFEADCHRRHQDIPSDGLPF